MIGLDSIALLVGAVALIVNVLAASILATKGELMIDTHIKLGIAKNGTSIHTIDGVLDPPKLSGKT